MSRDAKPLADAITSSRQNRVPVELDVIVSQNDLAAMFERPYQSVVSLRKQTFYPYLEPDLRDDRFARWGMLGALKWAIALWMIDQGVGHPTIREVLSSLGAAFDPKATTSEIAQKIRADILANVSLGYVVMPLKSEKPVYVSHKNPMDAFQELDWDGDGTLCSCDLSKRLRYVFDRFKLLREGSLKDQVVEGRE